MGINKAIKEFTDIEIILFGKEQEIQQYLEPNARVEIVHTDEKIEGTDEPVRAVRRKRMRQWF